MVIVVVILVVIIVIVVVEKVIVAYIGILGVSYILGYNKSILIYYSYYFKRNKVVLEIY